MAAAPHNHSRPIRVLLVDDSVVVRGMIVRGLRREPRIEIVSLAANGNQAIDTLKHADVDVVLLDIEMPEKDGLTALPEILQVRPNAKVIMVSSLTQRNAKISLQALELGAADCLAKPSAQGGDDALEEFYRALLEKVLALGSAMVQEKVQAPATVAVVTPEVSVASVDVEKPMVPKTPRLQKKPEVLAVASSTGGPQALLKFFKPLSDSLGSVPVFITQHMPPTFTELLADHIQTDTGLKCREAVDGEKVEAGRVYIAPGDYHMTVKRQGGDKVISLNQNPPVNFCRPAADPMFDSIVECYGGAVLAVVLTGMGNDGCKGAKGIKDAGGQVLVQDKETSVVWGMPGAIANQGFQDAILPLDQLSTSVKRIVGGGHAF